MFKLRTNTLLILVVLAALLGASYASASPETAPSVPQPMVGVQVYPIDESPPLQSFSTTFVQIADLTTFEVLSANSVIELTYEGGIGVYSFEAGNIQTIFEIRIDEVSSPLGLARASVGPNEANKRIPTTITGIWIQLAPGLHTASMWVKGINGGGTGPQANYYGWEVDHLLIKEYLPIGYTYMPIIRK